MNIETSKGNNDIINSNDIATTDSLLSNNVHSNTSKSDSIEIDNDIPKSTSNDANLSILAGDDTESDNEIAQSIKSPKYNNNLNEVKELPSTPYIYNESEHILMWFNDRLFECEILNIKTENKLNYYFLHYMDFSKRYDEWRLESDLVKKDPSNVELMTKLKLEFQEQKRKDKELKDAAHREQLEKKRLERGVLPTGEIKEKRTRPIVEKPPVVKLERPLRESRKSISAIGETVENVTETAEGLTASLETSGRKKSARKSKVMLEESAAPCSSPTISQNSLSNKKGKRKADNELSVTFPSSIQAMLMKDVEQIKNRLLLKLPKKTSDTVSSILAAWAALKPSATKRASLECGLMFAKSIEQYFNRILPFQLLYTFERQQFKYLEVEHSIQFSEIYGMEHLLRLLVLMPELIVQSSMDPNSYPFVVENLNDLMEFINYRLSNSSEYKYEYSKVSEAYVQVYLKENNIIDEVVSLDEFIPMGGSADSNLSPPMESSEESNVDSKLSPSAIKMELSEESNVYMDTNMILE